MANKKESISGKSVIAFLSDTVSGKIFSNVTAELGFEEVSIFQGSIENAKGFLKENRSPRILIVDVTNREMPLRDIVDLKELCDPSVNFIVIGEKNDIGIFRKLLTLGVKDYLVKPLNLNLVRESFSGILVDKSGFSTLASVKGGKVIGFVSSLGGSGATTFATNYAWSLASVKERKTLLIDMNFHYGDSNLLLDINFNEESFVGAMDNIEKIDEFFLQTFVTEADKKLFYLGYNEPLAVSRNVSAESVARLIDISQENYNYTVVDIAKSPQEVLVGASTECDYLYILSELTISSARETSKLLEYFIKQQGKQNVSVILNKLGIARRGALSKEAFEKVIGKPVYHVCGFDPVNPVSALNLGQILTKSKDNEIYKIVSNLIDEISNKKQFDVDESNNRDKMFGYIRKIFNKY